MLPPCSSSVEEEARRGGSPTTTHDLSPITINSIADHHKKYHCKSGGETNATPAFSQAAMLAAGAILHKEREAATKAAAEERAQSEAALRKEAEELRAAKETVESEERRLARESGNSYFYDSDDLSQRR